MTQLFSHSSIRRIAFLAGLIALVAPSRLPAQQKPGLPDAPLPIRVLTAQAQTAPPLAGPPQVPVPVLNPSEPAITLERALELAKRNNPALQANQMLILQNKAQEITANLRPNPV